MKNVLVANLNPKNKRYKTDKLLTLLKAQVENSIDLGWNKEDIWIVANFKFEYMGVKSFVADLNKFCWTGSKMFGLKWLADNNMFEDTLWLKDADLWQNTPFACPDFEDVGACHYSRPKFNGGSVFWRKTAIDIINSIVKRLTEENAKKEEPILNDIFKSSKYQERITVLNYTYNVGCSGYYERYMRSEKPIKACHFHPYNRIAWETHCLDRNGLGKKGISDRLETLIRKYYPDVATMISSEGKRRSIEKKALRIEKGIEKPEQPVL